MSGEGQGTGADPPGEPLRIAIVGAGAIGTLYGGWLISGGAAVHFVARPPRLDLLRSHGIRLVGKQEAIEYPAVNVSSLSDAGPADVLIFAVKLYDLEKAAMEARHLLADGGLAVGLQNGIGAWDLLTRAFDPAQVMVGPAYSAARLMDDGVVAYAGDRNDVVIGAPGRRAHRHATALVDAWRCAGVEAAICDDIDSALWTKLLVVATNAALTCLTRQPAGIVYHDPDLLDLARRSIDEIAAVARAEGVRLEPDATGDALALLRRFPADVVASMRQDLDIGKALELEGTCGEVVRRGRRHGIKTPFHDVAYACLKPYAGGRPDKADG